MLQGKNILITGGAGFIGTHLASRLSEDNQLTLLDMEIETNSLNDTNLATRANVRVVQGDVRDAELVEEEVRQCNVVIHLASLLGVQNVIDHARQTIDIILLGTRNVLQAASRTRHLERLINVSTSEIYGDSLTSTEAASACIRTENDPRLSYAAAKLMGEHLVWAYTRDYHLPCVNVRPFNVYGPLRRTSNAVGIFVVKALAGSDISVYGDGSQLRAWCYIDDFVDGVLACLHNPAAVGEDFNLGNPVAGTTVFDLAQRIIRLTGSNSRIAFQPCPYSEINMRVGNSEKAQRLLGYAATHDLDAGLPPTIAWHREHMNEFSTWV